MPAAVLQPPSARIRLVSSFDELINTRFADEVNALCWPRTLAGDFAEVARLLEVPQGITHLDEDAFENLPLSENGRLAAQTMRADLTMLREQGLDPILDCVNGYTHPIAAPHLRTDVCSWHADSATAEADTWLCTYHGASSEGLPNEHAICRIDVPEVRRLLLHLHGGSDDETFNEWLSEHFHDLHYIASPAAQPYLFGQGSLWRIATQYPGSPVPPCIHRAPDPVEGQKRLLLIS